MCRDKHIVGKGSLGCEDCKGHKGSIFCPSMGFSRQEYWSEVPFPSPGDLPDPGIERRSPALQADTLPSEPPGKPKYEKT